MRAMSLRWLGANLYGGICRVETAPPSRPRRKKRVEKRATNSDEHTARHSGMFSSSELPVRSKQVAFCSKRTCLNESVLGRSSQSRLNGCYSFGERSGTASDYLR